MNVLKALSSEGRREYAVLREKRARLLEDMRKVREEMLSLELHADIENVDLNAPLDESAPPLTEGKGR